MANHKDKVKVRRSIRIDPIIDELQHEGISVIPFIDEFILFIQQKHEFRTYTEALEYLLKEKAIELAIEEASLD